MTLLIIFAIVAFVALIARSMYEGMSPGEGFFASLFYTALLSAFAFTIIACIIPPIVGDKFETETYVLEKVDGTNYLLSDNIYTLYKTEGEFNQSEVDNRNVESILESDEPKVEIASYVSEWWYWDLGGSVYTFYVPGPKEDYVKSWYEDQKGLRVNFKEELEKGWTEDPAFALGNSNYNLVGTTVIESLRWGDRVQWVFERDGEYVAVEDVAPATEMQDWGDYGPPTVYEVSRVEKVVTTVVWERA